MEHLWRELKADPEDCESDLRSEVSESESWISYCSGIDSENIPWLQYVGSDGKLFYIKKDADVEPNFEDSLKHADPQESWPYIGQERSKLNAAEKIKQWMRNRGKKVRKSFPLLKSSRNETNIHSSEFDSLSSHEQSKDIFIDVDSAKTVPGYRSLSEKIFGLKLGSQDDNFGLCDKVIVLGILRGQIIPDIKIGDWLKSINDIDVNMGNLENVLKELPMQQSKVKLNIISSSEPKNTKSQPLRHRHDNLIKELLGDSSALEYAKLQFQHIPHGIFFFSTENGTFENDDILYRYPDQDTPLFQLHGMFLTIGLMIEDVATAPLLSCSVMIERQIVHIGFVKEGKSVMALAVPASVASAIEVQQFTTGIAKCLKFQFCTLRQAFLAENGENYLDNFFTLYFTHYLSSLHYDQSVFSEPHLLDILPTAHWLPLPNDLKTEIDDILTELESADFGNDSDGFCRDRRIYNIFGSCLFYKGYLISSTLPKDDLLDIHLFLHYSHILELTQMQPISRIIIWKEVFPSRHQEQSSDPKYEEVHGRWFIIIVVMQYSILAVLLDDDGCALKVEGHPTPEPFYVEEVQNTLIILQDCGLIAAIEKLLHFCVDPVVSSDLFFQNTSSRNSLSSMFASNSIVSIHSSGPHLSSVHSTSHSSLGALKEGPADGESGSESSYSNGSNENVSNEIFRSCSESTGSSSKLHESSECSEVYKDSENQLSRTFSSLPDLNGTSFTSDGVCFENSIRMVSGFGSNLFYYLHMDPVEGIFIAPVVPDLTMPGNIHSNILNSFHRCCMSMRTIFERSLRNAQMTKVNIKTKYGVNYFLQNAYEQGILFHCKKMDSAKQKYTSESGSFWVVGRLFFLPEPREVYVCYHGCTAQDVVEMAFRIGFGLSF